MIKLKDYKTESAFPAEMKTVQRRALAYAFDRQKKLFLERLPRVYIWANLDNVDDDKLDFLAVECRVLFYNSSLSPDVKRKLIQNSIYWYMKLGTRQAMEEMIDIVFGNENTTVEEWYTYAGEAFHFRVAVGTTVTQTSIREFLSYLNRIKNARSRFDYLVFQNGITLTLYQKSEYDKFIYTFCGEYESGTYPDISVGFQPANITLTLEGDSTEGRTVYEESGTRPDISVGAALMENKIEIGQKSLENNFPYQADSETESGTTPDISVGYEHRETQLDLQGESLENNIVYHADSEAESGTTPDISTGFQGTGSGIVLEPSADSGRTVYEESGTAPDISVGAALVENQADIQTDSSENKIVYPADSEAGSGTYPDVLTGFKGSGAEVGIDGAADSGRALYEGSGTYPDISKGFQGGETEIDIDGAADSGRAQYEGSGTFPDISIGAQTNEVQAVFESDSGGNQIVYPSDGETESGTTPDPAVGFAGTESGVSVSTDGAGHDLYYSTDAGKYAADE